MNLRTLKIKPCGILISIALIILGALSVMVPEDVEGSEFRIQPGITLGEEYNDNIFLAPENRSYDYISEIKPSIKILYSVPLWDWDVSYFYDYHYYARYTDLNTSQNQSNVLDLKNHTRIKDEYVFLDVKDNYSRVSLDLARDFTQESSFVNQTDRNILTVDPYFIMRPTSKMTVTTGYTYSNLWYKDPTAINQENNIVYTGLQEELSQRSILTAGIRHTQNRNSVQGYTEDDVYLGQRYEYEENSTLTGTIGNSWFNFPGEERTTQITWDANFTHRYSTMTVTFETGLRFVPDPFLILRRQDRYLATIRRDVERTSLVVSGGLIEYRDIKNKNLQNSDYRVNGRLSHAISTTSKIILDLSADWYWDYLAYTKTQRYLTGVRFEHLVAENLTLALEYRYTNSYTPDVYSDNYFNNRFSVELRMVF